MKSVTEFSKSMAQEIAGFDIIKQIGKGSIASVYLAVQKEFGREVAIKVMLPQFSSDARFKADFLRETRVAAHLNHSSIVPIYTAGEVDGCCYLTMEYMAGGNLRQSISQGMSEEQVLHIMLDLAMALDFAHSKAVVHGGVKPENILLREDGSVVLGDFGVARVIHESFSESASSGVLDYYAPYMSLEQALARAPDERSDIYSLGLVFYEMLTGEILHAANTSVFSVIKNAYASLSGPRLPLHWNHLQPVFEKMVARDPDDRYQTGKALADDLQNYLGRPEPVSIPAARDVDRDGDKTVRMDIKAVLAAAERGQQRGEKPASNVKQPQTETRQTKPKPVMVPLGKVTPRSLTIPALRPADGADNQLTSKAKIILAGCVASLFLAVFYIGASGTGQVPEQLIRGSADHVEMPQVASELDQGGSAHQLSAGEPELADVVQSTHAPASVELAAIGETENEALNTSPPDQQSMLLVSGAAEEPGAGVAEMDIDTVTAIETEPLDDLSLENNAEPEVIPELVEIDSEISNPTGDGTQTEIEIMMSAAADAMYDNHLLVPAENSAYELYMGVLEKDPEHTGAKAGLGQIVDRYLAIASQHLNEGELEQAEKFANRALLVAAQDNVAHEYELKVEDKLVVIRRVKNLEASQALDHWLALLKNKEKLSVTDLNEAFTAYMVLMEMNLYEEQMAEAKEVYADAFYDLGTRFLNDEKLDAARELIAKGLQINPKDEDLRALEARWVRWHDARAWVVE
ncbi:MAG: serine/threonine protein kinase [Ketobacter sp.]|nr:MAG: serine/threonine protein kinase [Ketobacter sp.]